jgi:hypothetical protein
VHGIALVEQQLGQIRAILPADAGDESGFHAEDRIRKCVPFMTVTPRPANRR